MPHEPRMLLADQDAIHRNPQRVAQALAGAAADPRALQAWLRNLRKLRKHLGRGGGVIAAADVDPLITQAEAALAQPELFGGEPR